MNNSINKNVNYITLDKGAKDGIVKEVAFGMLMLGIGYIGLLKSAIEMFENHRSDRTAQSS